MHTPSPQPSKRLRTGNSGDSTSNDRIKAIAVYILQTKLDSDSAASLFRVAESEEVYHDQESDAGGSVGVRFELRHEISDAEVVITALHMRKRLERHIDWELAVWMHYISCISF